MSTRRRVGFGSTSSSEASRRQLMQPVPCWEKVWALPDDAPPGTTLKVYRWIKTDKKQHFSDDEAETDQPLAPLPDEAEVAEGDEEMDQDEGANSVVPDTTPASREQTEPPFPLKDESSKPATPKPHPLSISFLPPSPTPVVDDADDVLDVALQTEVVDLDVPVIGDISVDMGLSMEDIGPDGEAFEGVADLSQLQATDALLGGGPLLDASMDDDPFSVPQA